VSQSLTVLCGMRMSCVPYREGLLYTNIIVGAPGCGRAGKLRNLKAGSRTPRWLPYGRPGRARGKLGDMRTPPSGIRPLHMRGVSYRQGRDRIKEGTREAGPRLGYRLLVLLGAPCLLPARMYAAQ
jgi:hypothetical protein